MVEDNFMIKPAARWLVAVTAAIFSCVVCACVMYGVNFAYIYYLTEGNMPVGYQAGADMGADLARSNPLYVLASVSLFCLPPAVMLPAAIAAYFLLDRYQKRKLEAMQQMPGPAADMINKG